MSSDSPSLTRTSTQPFQAGLFFTALLWVLAMLTIGMARVTHPQLKLLAPQVVVFGGLTLAFHLLFDRRRGDLLRRMRLQPLRLGMLLRVILVAAVTWPFILSVSDFFLKLVHLAGGAMPPLYQELLEQPFLIALLTGALLPAIFEELAFRGYLFGHLRPLGLRTSIILSGLLFGAMHLSLVRLIPLALLGMIFASAVQRTRSVGASVLMHFLNNGIVIVLAYLSPELAQPTAPVAPTLASLGLTLLVAVALGACVLAALRWLGPLQDPAGEEEYAHSMAVLAAESVAVGEARRLRRLSATLFFLGLLPGLLLYLLSAYGEWRIVFG